MNAVRTPALCQTCGNRGLMPHGTDEIPSWCTCTGKGPRGGPGPFVAPPGVIVRYIFETPEAAAWRERCRLAGNAERRARDAICEATYYPSGRKRPGWQKLRRAAIRAHDRAIDALEALQLQCSHPSRSMFSPVHCDVCYAHVECNVEHFRHLVREIGKRAAMRLAV